jgi:cytidylate kinase
VTTRTTAGTRAAQGAIVTVASEHGAGGDLVAPRVAEALGVRFLDRALPASLLATDEDVERPSGLAASLARASSVFAGEPVERMDLDEGQRRAELAEFMARSSTDGGVLLGRGGMVLLANAPGALHVLLAGDLDGRVERVAERDGVSREEARRRVRVHDRARLEHARRVFSVDSGDRTLYHLVIDTVALGIDATVELVVAASRARTPPSPPTES